MVCIKKSLKKKIKFCFDKCFTVQRIGKPILSHICTGVSLLYVVYLSVYMLVHKYSTNGRRRNLRIYFSTIFHIYILL